VLLPNINESYSKFTVHGDKIRFGLAAVKNVGINVIESIVKSREERGVFIGLSDFCNKIDTAFINKRAVESLIKAGAFDVFNIYRSKLLAVYEKLLDGIISQRKKNIEGQISLFGGYGSSDNSEYNDVEVKYPNIKEFDKKYILAMEKEMTGLYLSGHPLEEYEETLKIAANTKISEIMADESLEDDTIDEVFNITDGDRVIIGGIISAVSKKITKSNAMMAFLTLEDLYGSIEVIVFPKTFEKVVSLINEDEIVVIKGRVSIREDEKPKILCEDIKPLIKVNKSNVYVLIEEEKLIKKIISDIKPTLIKYSGNTPVYLCTNKERKKFMLDKELWIDESIEILGLLREIFGEKNVKVL
jgi:DNA polymerase-3 subunit alpha